MKIIDADEIVYESIDSSDTAKYEYEHGTGIFAVRKEDIDAMPTIQPEPKRGKWIKTARWGRVYYCDQCRNYLDFDGVNAGRGSTNFCPNCGAKMEVTE